MPRLFHALPQARCLGGRYRYLVQLPALIFQGGVALGGRGGCRLLDRPAGAVLVVPLLYARFYRRQSRFRVFGLRGVVDFNLRFRYTLRLLRPGRLALFLVPAFGVPGRCQCLRRFRPALLHRL